MRIVGLAVAIMNIGIAAYLVSTQFDVSPWGVFVVFLVVLPASVMVPLPLPRYRSLAFAALGASLSVLFLLAGVVAIGLAVLSHLAAVNEIVSGNYFPPGAAGPLVFMLFASAGVVLTKIYVAERRLISSQKTLRQ